MCGCGRPARTTDQAQRDAVRRPVGSGGSGARQLGDDGFVWRGPRRPPQQAKAETTTRRD